MSSRSVFVSTLLIAGAALGVGFWLGKHSTTTSATAPQEAPAEQTSEQSPGKLPPPSRRRPAPANAADLTVLTADWLSKLQTAQAADFFRSSDWLKTIDQIDPSAFPGLLAGLEKNPSKSVRDRMRAVLLPRWAKADPTGAMAYASGLTNRIVREEATRP